jgi:hypothetical protein
VEQKCKINLSGRNLGFVFPSSTWMLTAKLDRKNGECLFFENRSKKFQDNHYGSGLGRTYCVEKEIDLHHYATGLNLTSHKDKKKEDQRILFSVNQP